MMKFPIDGIPLHLQVRVGQIWISNRDFRDGDGTIIPAGTKWLVQGYTENQHWWKLNLWGVEKWVPRTDFPRLWHPVPE